MWAIFRTSGQAAAAAMAAMDPSADWMLVDAEDVMGVGHGLLEQEVGAAVGEEGQALDLLGHRAEGRACCRWR